MKKYLAAFVVAALATSLAFANTDSTTTTEAGKQDTTRAATTASKKKTVLKKKATKKKLETSSLKSDEVVATQVPAVASDDNLAPTSVETPVVTSQSAPIAVETSRTTVAPRFIDNVILSDALYFYGPGVAQMDSNQPDATSVDGGGKFQFENIATLGYRALNDVAISANINHIITPRGDAAGGNVDVIKDPYLRIKASNLINRGGFNFAADLRTYMPVSQKSVKNNQAVSIRSTQYASYAIGRFTLASTTYIRHFSLRGDSGKSWEVYAGPEIGYQISPNVSAALLYEMLATHQKGATSGLSNEFADGAGTDLEPSITWQFTPAMSITPYLDIKTGGDVSWKTTSVNMLFVANIL